MLTDEDCIFNINYCFHVRGSMENAKVVPIVDIWDPSVQRLNGVPIGLRKVPVVWVMFAQRQTLKIF